MEPNARFWEFAEECERLAALSRNNYHRAILRQMADAWRKIAQTEPGQKEG